MRLLAETLLMMVLACPLAAASRAEAGTAPSDVIAREIKVLQPEGDASGLAIALRIEGRTSYFNYGFSNIEKREPVTSDSLFNLASVGKVFDTTLLAQAVRQRELSLDDPVAKYVTELENGGDIRAVTLGQLATHTSGLLLPQDHPPWPTERYTVTTFIDTLNRWNASEGHRPGKQHEYTHAGFILLHLALERRFGVPLRTLIEQRVLKPLGMTSTALPGPGGSNPRGDLEAALKTRAVQGYDDRGTPVGEPGNIQGYYLWPGTGQMFSSARDMATFLAANLGELPGHQPLQKDMQFAQHARFPMNRDHSQALAWELDLGSVPLVEKNGGLNNTSTYIGMIPDKRIGIVMLSNRGEQNVAKVSRRVLLELAFGPAGTRNGRSNHAPM